MRKIYELDSTETATILARTFAGFDGLAAKAEGSVLLVDYGVERDGGSHRFHSPLPKNDWPPRLPWELHPRIRIPGRIMRRLLRNQPALPHSFRSR